MELSKHLSRLRKQRRLTQSAVAQYLTKHGPKTYTFKTVSQWETGVSEPSVEAFLLLCGLYEVSDIRKEFGMSNGDARVSAGSLNPLGVERVSEYTQLLMRDPRFRERPSEMRVHTTDKKVKSHIIRLYDLPVSAGDGVFLDGADYEDYETTDGTAQYADFALRIQGDSMLPDFEDGQVVFIERTDTISPGEIGIFSLNGDAYCKKLGNGELISLNSKYSPIEIGEYDSLFALGRVLG